MKLYYTLNELERRWSASRDTIARLLRNELGIEAAGQGRELLIPAAVVRRLYRSHMKGDPIRGRKRSTRG